MEKRLTLLRLFPPAPPLGLMGDPHPQRSRPIVGAAAPGAVKGAQSCRLNRGEQRHRRSKLRAKEEELQGRGERSPLGEPRSGCSGRSLTDRWELEHQSLSHRRRTEPTEGRPAWSGLGQRSPVTSARREALVIEWPGNVQGSQPGPVASVSSRLAGCRDLALPIPGPVASAVTHLRVMKPWNQGGAAPCCRSPWACVFWNQARVSACSDRPPSLGTSSACPASSGLVAVPRAWGDAC